jgi:hypothetical protein
MNTDRLRSLGDRRAPVPDGHTVCPAETPSEQNNTRTLAVFMPDTNTNPLASGPPSAMHRNQRLSSALVA